MTVPIGELQNCPNPAHLILSKLRKSLSSVVTETKKWGIKDGNVIVNMDRFLLTRSLSRRPDFNPKMPLCENFPDLISTLENKAIGLQLTSFSGFSTDERELSQEIITFISGINEEPAQKALERFLLNDKIDIYERILVIRKISSNSYGWTFPVLQKAFKQILDNLGCNVDTPANDCLELVPIRNSLEEMGNRETISS